MRSITRYAGAAVLGAALVFAAAPMVQAEQSSPGASGTSNPTLSVLRPVRSL